MTDIYYLMKQFKKSKNNLKNGILFILNVPIPIAMEVQATSLSTSELEVMQWLESIGFERYQQNFVAAKVFSFDVVRGIDSVNW